MYIFVSPAEVISNYYDKVRKITEKEIGQYKKDLNLLVLPKLQLIMLCITGAVPAIALTGLLVNTVTTAEINKTAIVFAIIRILVIMLLTKLFVLGYKMMKQTNVEDTVVLECNCKRIIEHAGKHSTEYLACIESQGNECSVSVVFRDFDMVNRRDFRAKILLHELSSTIVMVPDYSTEAKLN